MGFFNGFNTGGLTFWLVAIPFLIIAVIFIVGIVRANGKVRASKNWSSTSARILASDVEMRRTRSGTGTGTSYYPAVVYEYAVNGQRFQSRRIRFGTEIGYGFRRMAENTVAKYPNGGLVSAFYDPQNPTEAVLEQSAGGSNRMFGCIVLVILGILLVTGIFTFGGFQLMSQITRLLPH
ncbi:MAG: DUF3592 domain-containing protein [Chloroflexota bacterium]